MRFIKPSTYIIAFSFLVIGHSLRVQTLYLGDEPAIVCSELWWEESVWMPAERNMKLESTPPARITVRRDEVGDGYVRPAWGMLGAIMILFLYLWIQTEYGSHIATIYLIRLR